MRRNFKFSIAAAVAITAVSANLALADDHRYEIYLNSANQLVYDLYNDAYPSTLIGSGYSITGDFDKGEIVSVGANGSHNANTIEVKLGSSGSFGGKNIIVGEYQDEDVALNIIEIVSGTDFGNIIGGKSSTGDVSSNAITFSLGANNSAKANDIIASQSDLGGANGNVDIRDSVVTANNIYGAKSISGLVKNAGVWLDRYSKIAISGSIYGGSSKDGIATGNQVDIWSRGSILGNVYGGKSENGKADGNLLKISNADIALYKDIYGGSSDKSDAIKNKVSILDGVLLGNTYGGYSNSGNTQENSVAINGGRIDYEVYGGYSNSGNAQENSVSISGGRASWKIYGGYSNSGNAYGNSVVISNGTTMAIVGGETNSGKAYNNNISISGGTIGQGVESLIGGRSTNGNAENNSVEISGGTLLANVEGGYSDTGNAVGNSVVISGGTIGDVQHPNGVVGGISYKGDAIGNSVTISGGTINGDVFGGTTTYGKSIDNKVYYTGGNILEDIYGGSNSFDISGNELFIGTAQTPAIGLSARNVYWFETINFYLPNSVKYNDVALKLTTTGDTDLSSTKVGAFLSDASNLNGNGVIHLIQTAGKLTAPSGADVSGAVVNIAGLINIQANIELDTNQKNLDLIFSGSSSSTGNSKILLENKLSQSVAINEASNLLLSNLDNISNSANSSNANSLNNDTQAGKAVAFGFVNGGSKDYETGSHIEVKGFNASAGIAWADNMPSGDLTTALFVEYGKSKFESFLDNGVTGEGDTEFIGGGAFGKFKFTNNFYTEASAKVGKIKTNVNKGLYDEYKISSTYYGAHLGLGKIYDLTSFNELDIYTKFIYSKVAGNDVVLSGVNTHFDSVTSLRAQVGLKDSIKFSDTSKIYAGLAYRYEFDGKSKGNLSLPNLGASADIASPKLKGGTGIGEIGYTYETNSIKFDIGAKGYVGKERGYSGNLGVTFKF